MLDPLEQLGHLVAAARREGRVGALVAARIILHEPAGSDLPRSGAQALDRACTWLDSAPNRLWARGDADHLSIQATTTAGGSLLIVACRGEHPRPRLEAVLVGNRGLLNWDGRGELEWLAQSPSLAPLSPRGERVLLAMTLALASAQPVEVDAPQRVDEPPRQTTPRPVAPSAWTPRPTSPPLGVLLVTGNQSHQENYARAFAADARCRLVGLVDEPNLPERRQELNAQLAHELSIPLLDSFDDAIHRDDVQIISICAAPERRAALIERCAASGKHLYLDKPLAASVEEADAIIAAIERGGGLHQMFSLVHSTFNRRVRQVVESGVLGELRGIHCDAFFAKGPAGLAQLGRPRREQEHPTRFETIEAKRELHNVGVYSLVLIGWLLDRPVERIFANTENYFFAEHQREDMEDYAHLTLELAGGVVATVATGRTGWRSHPMSGMNRVTLVGTRGTTTVDAFQPRLDVWADEEPWSVPSRHPEDPMGFWSSTSNASGARPKRAWIPLAETTDDIRAFVDCVVAGRPSNVPAPLAARVMEMLMASYASAASGRAVPLPLTRRAAT